MAKKKEIEKIEEEETEEIVDAEEVEDTEDEDTEAEEVVEEVVSSSEDEEDEYVELTMEERIVNIEKKANLNLVLTAIVVVLSLITMIVAINGGNVSSNSSSTASTTEEESSSSSYDTSAFKEITAQDIASESKGKTIVVMIGRQGCGYCAQYAPILTQVSQELGFTARYIDFLKIVDLENQTISDSEAYETIQNLSAVSDFEGAGEEALQGTPATLIIKNSKIQYYIKGAADADTITEIFKKYDLSD